MIPPPISDIPPGQAGQVVQDFIDFDEVKQLTVDEKPDGKFTVTPLQVSFLFTSCNSMNGWIPSSAFGYGCKSTVQG